MPNFSLHKEFNDVNSPDAWGVAALQVAFPNNKTMLHKLIWIKLAGGVNTDLLRKIAEAKAEELFDVCWQRDQLGQLFMK